MSVRGIALVVAMALPAAATPPPGGPAPAVAALEVVGRNDLGARGMNSALAVSGRCAYLGSRATQAVAIVDVGDPAQPAVAGELPAHPGATARELRAVPSQHLLVVMSYLQFNGFDVYRWDDDCRHPLRIGGLDLGARQPHEFYLWEDPANANRVLLFVAMFGADGNALDVIDLSDPTRPATVGGWAHQASPLHSIDVAADGRTAYLSLWTGGLLVADVGDFTAGRPNPQVRLLTPTAAALRFPPGNVHSAVPVPGRSLVVITDERYPPPYGPGCPYGVAHVVDVGNPSAPGVASVLQVPENDPDACGAAPFSTWSSHNATVTPNLALISWYSAGLQVFDIAAAAGPVRLAEHRPSGANPAVRDPALGTTASMTWSYPVISGGLIYVADINQGLVVLRYRGPHQEEVGGAPLLEGNSNAIPGAGPSVVAGASPQSPGGSPAPALADPGSTGMGLSTAAVPVAAGVVAVVVIGLSVAARLRRRRRRMPRSPADT